MDLNQQSSADHIIEHLLAIDVDGETMEYIVSGANLNYQILKQLLIKSSDDDLNNIEPEEKYYANYTSWLERDSDNGSDY